MTRDFPGKAEIKDELRQPTPTEKHEEDFAPTMTAHLVAQHLRALVRLIPELPEQCRPPADFHFLFGVIADRLVALHPIEPLTDEEKDVVFKDLMDTLADMGPRDIARMLVDDWTDAEWRDNLVHIRLSEQEDTDEA